MANPETIAAVATPPGQGGVGIVRVSGPDLTAVAAGLLGRLPTPRLATHADFFAGDGSVIDNGIALYFRAPHSYTGEDVLEFQGHGGPVVIHMVLRRCQELGARLAEPGEFTRRAFLNGKIDLAQAESVADVIAAASESAARCAVRSLRGEFSASVDEIDRGLLELRKYVEATLDFPEEDIDETDRVEINHRLSHLINHVSVTLDKARQGSLLREGVTAVLAGRPNVGKSSLMNRLAGEEVSIVTATPGTTRDALKHSINLGGIPVRFIDTAGLRDAAEEIEAIGIQKSWKAIEEADLVLFVVDAKLGWTTDDESLFGRFPTRIPAVVIFNKSDLVEPQSGAKFASRTGSEIFVSAKTGDGIEKLTEMARKACGLTAPLEDVFLGRARHLEALAKSLDALVRAQVQIDAPELMAEELRFAHRAFGSITGQITADDLLGEIFSSFCIGK